MIPTFGAKTMSHDTTIEPTGKPEPRERKGTVLTDLLCETLVTERKKHFDRKCRGLYVSITPPCVASFHINYTDAAGRATSASLPSITRTPSGSLMRAARSTP
jgi:hypothetical protein